MFRRSQLRFAPIPIGLYLVASIVVAPGTPAHASEPARYVGGGTAVARTAGSPTADEGSMVCDNGEGAGVGGFCVPFGGGDAIKVIDEAAGENVAFQVCVDNDGDSRCTSPAPSGTTCPDQIAFSHDDLGNFFNPVGPVPTGFLPGCTGGPWSGYVVFLCQGSHVAGHDAGHTHQATNGTGTVTSGGEGVGSFCGGTQASPSSKRYFLGGARYAGGGAAVVRDNGEAAADEGAVVCDTGDGVGSGGFCVPFGAGDAVAVNDDALGEDVAFQVCVDNNGDGQCTSPDPDPDCPDQIAFSHDDKGNFFNPVGPLPTGFLPGCSGGAWPGYVVFLCQGVHVANGDRHSHPATSGEGKVTTGAEGAGNFCGGAPVRPSRKPYSTGVGSDVKDGLCTFEAASDPTVEGGQRSGEIKGGPVAAARFENGGPTSATQLTCTIQIGAASANGTDAVVATASGTGVAVLSPTVVSFQQPEGQPAFVCTEVTVDDVTYYYDATAGDFTTDADAGCRQATEAELEPPPGPVEDVLAQLRELGINLLDPLACPLLAALAPGIPGLVDIDGEGDVSAFGVPLLDCPPYESGSGSVQVPEDLAGIEVGGV